MQKSKKDGISLLVLVITIVVTIILASTIVISYNAITTSTLKKEFAKEIYTIQKQVEQYKFMNNIYPLGEDITIDLSTINESNKIEFKDENGYESGKIILKKIDLYEAGVESVKRGVAKDGDTADVYAYSTVTGKAYYIKGVKISKVMYYSLTDELRKQIGL